MPPVLVAAAKFELEPLVLTLTQLGCKPEVCLLGVGALNAAKESRNVAEACRGRDVIFVGTCGVFAAFEKVVLVRANEAIWLPTCVRMNLAYTIKDSCPTYTLPSPPAWASTLPIKRVLCSPSISLVDKLPDGFNPDHCVENIELYSCISEISASCSSLAVILAITNQVGIKSHSQWVDHFAIAAEITAKFIAGNLK